LYDSREAFFRMVAILIKFAPIGSFGAFAFTIGKYGINSIANLAALIVTFHVTSVLFIAIVSRLIAHASRFSLSKLLQYLKEDIWLVIDTSLSEATLPSLM
jgi:aerobic C4-dicarboxylate transport protein